MSGTTPRDAPVTVRPAESRAARSRRRSGGRAGYLFRRLAQALLVVALSYTLVFFVLFVLPGNPIEQQIDNPQNPLPEADAAVLRTYYNLDKPAIEQFGITLGRLLQGDLGFSLTTAKPVLSLLLGALPQTVALTLLALLFSIVTALAIAITAVLAPWQRLRSAAASLPVLFLSTPTFLVSLILLSVFSFQLGWVSAIRDQGFISLVLPAMALAIAASGPIAQVLIEGLRRAVAEPWVQVLRGQGNSTTRIVARHLLKNGGIPALTLLAMTVGDLLAGSVIVEAIFSRTGIGYLTQQAVRDQDTPMILAIVILVSVVFVVINLAVDLLYPLIDPRIEVAGLRGRWGSSWGSARRALAGPPGGAATGPAVPVPGTITTTAGGAR